jgi:hypothetical protein
LRRYELGQEGEIGVFSELDKLLGSEYKLFKNLIFKNRGYQFDIDAVIVGPKGIILFEIKNYAYPLVFNGQEIYYQIGNSLVPMPSSWDPRVELIKHFREFKKYLFANGFDNISINKAVVFLKKYSARYQDPGVYLISGVDDIVNYLETLPTDARFTPEFCEKLNSVLKK